MERQDIASSRNESPEVTNNKDRKELLARRNSLSTDYSDLEYLSYKFLIDAVSKSTKYARGRLLDFGCGNKPFEELFENVSLYLGCDISQSSEQRVDVICSAPNIPMADDSFDVVFSSQVIEHIQEPWTLCEEFFRVLRPNGYVIITGPMYWPLHEEPFDFYRYTKHGFRHLLTRAGFEIVDLVPNGGKWALFGLVSIQTFQNTRLNKPLVTKAINRFFFWMDQRRFDDMTTSNYLVVAKKNEK